MSCEDIPEIPDNSVDLIITDPPYPKEHLPIFGSLARFAVRKLKPGGSLVFYYNRYYEPEIHRLLGDVPELTYWWTFCVRHGSIRGSRIHERGVIVGWKPMMWFVKKGSKKSRSERRS